MVAFPIFSAVISLCCAGVVGRDAWRRPRPDKVVWTAAFLIFAVAAGAEVVGSLGEWTAALARLYYLSGAVLVVGYLALGELYLLAGARIARVAPGVALLVTAVAATVVWNAPVDQARLAADGWEAIERGPGLKVLAISLNAGGTLVLAGGALWSAWRFRRLGGQRHRLIGCLLIAAGTLAVASGGTLTRLGHREYLYIAMSIGVSVIFAGYLTVRGTGEAVSARRAVAGRSPAVHANGYLPATLDPAIAFLESAFLPLDDAALAERGRVWSVPRREVAAFTRDEARFVWAFRLRLSSAGQEAFDAQSAAAKLQCAELWHEVFKVEAERRPSPSNPLSRVAGERESAAVVSLVSPRDWEAGGAEGGRG